MDFAVFVRANKHLFKHLYSQFPFDFLLLFDVSRVKKKKKKEMLFKILTCNCFIGTFHSESFDKKLFHFHCKCKTHLIKEKHKLFVLFCENHLFDGKKGAYSHQHKECTCINESVHDICKY